jgi:hypothetical protein
MTEASSIYRCKCGFTGLRCLRELTVCAYFNTGKRRKGNKTSLKAKAA